MSATNAIASVPERMAALQKFVTHHVGDSHILNLPFVPIRLPEPLTSQGVTVILAALLLVVLFAVARRKRGPVPTGLANLLELFVVFVRDHIAVPYLGPEDGRRMTPLFCTFFSFILGMNLIGLVPSFGAATANYNVTGALAVVTLGFMIFGAMVRHGPVGFVKGLIPHGVPWPVAVILFPIEVAGLFIRVFALAIRLFANMLSGHMVLFFLVGLVAVFGLRSSPLLAMAVFISMMEVGVAFLQAYMFTLLSAIFIGQRLHPEH